MTAHNNDPATLHRRLDTLTRAAARIRQHIVDLYGLGWDAHVGEALEGDMPGFESRPPKAGDSRARRLYDEIFTEVANIEAQLVGLDRRMVATFTARAERPDPTRGSTISVAEFDRLRARQRQRRADGEHVPARLEGQPPHPGKRR